DRGRGSALHRRDDTSRDGAVGCDRVVQPVHSPMTGPAITIEPDGSAELGRCAEEGHGVRPSFLSFVSIRGGCRYWIVEIVRMQGLIPTAARDPLWVPAGDWLRDEVCRDAGPTEAADRGR